MDLDAEKMEQKIIKIPKRHMVMKTESKIVLLEQESMFNHTQKSTVLRAGKMMALKGDVLETSLQMAVLTSEEANSLSPRKSTKRLKPKFKPKTFTTAPIMILD